jgi:DNA-binding GntR family transcriptional regulator
MVHYMISLQSAGQFVLQSAERPTEIIILALQRPDTLRHKVEKQLREAIMTGYLKPGQRLIERELCEAMGISRPSLREALRRLEAEKLIEIVPHRGPVVAAISAQEARELYELRVLLESYAAGQYAARATKRSAEELKHAVRVLREAAAELEPGDLLKAKEAFYEVLLAGCGNAVIAEVLRMLLSRINRLRSASLSRPGRLPESVRELELLVRRVAAGDADGAARAAATHVRNAEKAALAMLHEHEAAKVERSANGAKASGRHLVSEAR